MSLNRLNVLYIEDDAADAIIIREALSRHHVLAHDFQITRVETMKGAMKMMRLHEYDVVLLDMNLPDLQGLDNVRCIYGENPAMPIIVLTSADNHNLARDVLEAGAQEYVVKGHCNGPILQRIIQSSIVRKRLEGKSVAICECSEVHDTLLPVNALPVTNVNSPALSS